MSEERNIDPFSLLILVLSIIAIVTELIGPFAGFYLGGGNYRYSCLDCEYSTGVDIILQYIILILLVIQILIALNELLPSKFIPLDVNKYGMYLAIMTWIFAIVGLASFGITYSGYEWWPELGFYGIVVGGLLNTILFFLKERNK
jgi:Na+-transporting NADH:ubiquinone oxidoreductase subunit NqrE